MTKSHNVSARDQLFMDIPQRWGDTVTGEDWINRINNGRGAACKFKFDTGKFDNTQYEQLTYAKETTISTPLRQSMLHYANCYTSANALT